MLRTILMFTMLVFYSIYGFFLWFAAWIVHFFNPEKADYMIFYSIRRAARLALWISGMKTEVYGKENIPGKGTASVFVINHRSIFDIISLYPLLENRTGFVAKDSLNKVPVFRIWIKKLHGLFLNREDIREGVKTIKEATDILFAANRETDPRVEKELLAQALSEFYTNLDMSYFGPYQRWIQRRFGYNWSEAADYLWGMSLVSQPSMTAELESIDDLANDSLLKFLTDSPLALYDINDGHASKLKDAKKFSSEYLKARYWAGVRNNEPEYPDADATLRLAFGAADGTVTPVTTLLGGLGQGASVRWKAALQKDFWGRWGFRVNGKRHKMATTFMTDIDFADGMEGSPVIDAQGRLIGIVSGGTESSVVGKRAYLEGSSGSVCTDIRFILWTLDRYAGQKRILKEFEID